VLDDNDRSMIRGYLINKFRGNVGLFDAGLADITERTDWPSLGVVTWSRDLAGLPAEDAVELEALDRGAGDIHIAVPMLSRIANFDDVDPLGLEPDVTVTMVPPGQPLPAADVVLIPGTKSTIADLAFFRQQGWHTDLATHVRRGVHVIGVCGGYQMLGKAVADPEGVEGHPGIADGLDLLEISTTLHADKITRPVTGVHPDSATAVAGYEIHVGRTEGPGTERPWLEIDGRSSGAVSPDGRVVGSYVHGVFASDDFRSAYLAQLRPGRAASDLRYSNRVDTALNAWANQLEAELDLDRMLDIAAGA